MTVIDAAEGTTSWVAHATSLQAAMGFERPRREVGTVDADELRVLACAARWSTWVNLQISNNLWSSSVSLMSPSTVYTPAATRCACSSQWSHE